MASGCIEQNDKGVGNQGPFTRCRDRLLLRDSLSPFLLVVAFGFLARFLNYLRNDSLNLDENLLALNIVSRSFSQLLHPLRFEQSAPPLFLWVERLAIATLGVHERALRLIPLIAGAALVYASWKLALRLGNIQIAALVAALMAVSPCMVQYSTEAKQYGLDPIISVLLAILMLALIEKPDSKRWLILLFSGTVAIGFSMPAAFVLAGIWCGLLAVRQVRQTRGAHWWFLISAAVWAVGFAACYAYLYSSTASNSYMRRFWMGTFLRDRSGLFERSFYVMSGLVEPLFVHASAGLRSANMLPLVLILGATMIPAVMGLIILVRRFRFMALAIFCVPILAAAAASALGQWIFTARLMLYTTPFLAILIGAGLWHLCENRSPAIILVISGLGFASLFQTVSEHLVRSRAGHSALEATVSLAAGLGVAYLLWQITVVSKYGQSKTRFLVASAGLMALPAVAVLLSALHVSPDGPKTLIRFFAARSHPTDSIYLGARAVPAWIFYTTNWSRTGNANVTQLMQAATSIGPNSGNAASRQHDVRNEGGELKFYYRDGLELVGIPTGTQNTALGEQAGKLPDRGWAENEAARISSGAEPRVWVLVSNLPDSATHQLLDAIALVQGRELLRRQTNDSTLVLYDFPLNSSQVFGNDSRSPASWKSLSAKSAPGSSIER